MLRRQRNKKRGEEFRRWAINRKAFWVLAANVQKARTLKVLTNQLHDKLRQRHGPKAFRQLKFNQLKEKEKKIKL